MKKKAPSTLGFTLIELLIVVAIIGTIAAIAIPNLMRARMSANESRVIGDTRTVISANHAYASANCGLFAANLRCMTRTGGICIPNYPSSAPEFLGGDLARFNPNIRSGYTRRYHGVGAPAGGVSPLCDAASVLNFCYRSEPSSPGLTGVRSFSGNAAGAMFADPTGAAIACPIPAATTPLE